MACDYRPIFISHSSYIHYIHIIYCVTPVINNILSEIKNWMKLGSCNISRFYEGSECEDYCVMGCDTM
jgi:surface polysaccharide O-acyltransferase-like enzyme